MALRAGKREGKGAEAHGANCGEVRRAGMAGRDGWEGWPWQERAGDYWRVERSTEAEGKG